MASRDGRSSDLKGTARERLLDAALDELRARGYDGASLQSIARRAGLTKGAIYWSFRDKHDVFRALVESRLDGPARALMRITETAPREGTTGDLVSKGVAQLAREHPELVLLAHEQWALAVRDPTTKPAYLARQALLREALAKTLQARHETTGIPLTYPAERLATAVLALANGLAAEALVDPEAVPDELLGDMLTLLYDGLAARAESDGVDGTAIEPLTQARSVPRRPSPRR